MPVKRLIIIDGNPVMYRAYHAPGTRHLRTSKKQPSGGFFGFLRTFLALKKRLEKSHYLFCFDHGRSWRNEVSDEYKTHSEASKPVGFSEQLEDARHFLTLVGVPVAREPWLEADDLISVYACQWTETPGHTAVIVSSDRDYFQLVSDSIMVYDDRAKKFYGPREVEQTLGVKLKYTLDYRCLVGDKADRLSGVLGFGPKRASSLCHIAPAVLKGLDLQIYERNKLLMQLPRSAYELHVPMSDRKRVHHDVLRQFQRFHLGCQTGLVQPALAQALLDSYECRSLDLYDFLSPL